MVLLSELLLLLQVLLIYLLLFYFYFLKLVRICDQKDSRPEIKPLDKIDQPKVSLYSL